jgi:tRNA pseudouridine38-40 synthase
MKRYLLSFAYDGSGFYGWQKQPKKRTVQGELESCLGEIAKTVVKTTGSSRTDTGVHALTQYAHFDFPIDLTPLQLQLALTTKLPKDIKIHKAFVVDNEFSSRFQAVGRSYRFVITKELTPFNRLYRSYFPRHTVYVEAIKNVLPLFMGAHDFELFCQKNPELKTFVSVVTDIDFREEDDGYIFEITADRFLHNMVRRIVGTLVRLSGGNNIEEVISGLLSKNRDYLHLVFTAPPQGLYLTNVIYKEPFL